MLYVYVINLELLEKKGMYTNSCMSLTLWHETQSLFVGIRITFFIQWLLDEHNNEKASLTTYQVALHMLPKNNAVIISCFGPEISSK